MCGVEFGLYECNEDRGIFTMITDTDAEGTKRKSMHFCNDCANTVYTTIQIMAIERQA